MSKYKRIFTIVVDSLGIGAMEDSPRFGDEGVDTLGHIAAKMEEAGTPLCIPNLQKLGLANLKPLEKVEPVEKPLGYIVLFSESMSSGRIGMK